MTAAPAAPSYTRSDWSSAFRNVGQELSDVVLEPTRGQIPDELAGSALPQWPWPPGARRPMAASPL